MGGIFLDLEFLGPLFLYLHARKLQIVGEYFVVFQAGQVVSYEGALLLALFLRDWEQKLVLTVLKGLAFPHLH